MKRPTGVQAFTLDSCSPAIEWRHAGRTGPFAVCDVLTARLAAPRSALSDVCAGAPVIQLHFARGRPDALQTLSPAYFALVMATGIVAAAARLHGVPVAPVVLFWLNAAFLAGLIVATCARAWRYPAAFAADIGSHSRGVGFFTAVAALAVFGDELVLQMHAIRSALFFWAAAAALLPVVLYGELAALTVRPDKPGLAGGLSGAWLLAVVAAQSVSILTVSLSASGAFAASRQPLMFLALVLWLGAGALYLWLITLIFYRTTFLPMAPEDFTPPYWINMGAAAISTLAGASLMGQSALSPIVTPVEPFIMGLTLLFWAVGSFWIPLLALLTVWAHLIRGLPFAYSPLGWGAVFPLGMYSVCTYHLAQIVDAPFLAPISSAFMVVAAAAWTATFAGLVDSRLNATFGRNSPTQTQPAGSTPGDGAES
jgi:tellurite resistance protein TehA-like permease